MLRTGIVSWTRDPGLSDLVIKCVMTINFLESWPPNVLFQLTNLRRIEDCFLDSGSGILECPLWEVFIIVTRIEIFMRRDDLSMNVLRIWIPGIWNLVLETF